jgi:hypothetical protein
MPDVITRSSTTSYGGRVQNAFKGVIGGLLAFALSFPLLYWNEGRVDLSKIAERSQHVPAESTVNVAPESFISTTGTVAITEKVGDSEYLQPGAHIALTRVVEIYAWVEESEEKTSTNSDGSETTETTYTYTQEWTENLQDSDQFAEPVGHQNPKNFDIKGGEWRVPTVTVGAWSANTKDLDLPPSTDLTLTKEILTQKGAAALRGQYLFFGTGAVEKPVVGDERVSYRVVSPNFSGTIFGQATNGAVSRYTDSDGNTLFRLFTGDRAAALATLHQEYLLLLWIFRALGFLMMWFGLAALLKPFAAILDRFPFIGSIAKAGVSVVTFAIALPLSIMTIVVSAILHSWIALATILLLVLGYIWWSKSRATSGGTPAPAK